MSVPAPAEEATAARPAAAPPPPGPHAPRAALSLADFDLLRRLGSGAFAEVFLATPRHRIPGVAWPAGSGCEEGEAASASAASAASDPATGWPAALPPCALALKVVDKHLLTRTPGAVDAVRRERDIMDALGALAAAAERGGASAAPPPPPVSSALARLPAGLHARWAATRTVRLLFTFQDAASLYFGLEACPGGDLFGQLAARGRLRAGDAVPYLADAVAALAALASVGVAHRDVKPENFMLDAGGRLKLGDFGCAAWADGRGREVGRRPPQPPPPPPHPPSSPPAVASHPLARETRAPSFVGTADYVPPEALGGLNAPSDSDSEGGGGSGGGSPPPPPPPPPFAADAWALGCVAYQLLVGVPPFRAATEWLTYQRIAAHDLRWPGGGNGNGSSGSRSGGTSGAGEQGDGGAASDASADALPPTAIDLITCLLDPDPHTRLGGGGEAGGGMDRVMAHPFFSAVDWSAPGGGLPAPPPVPPPPPGVPGPGEDPVSAAEDEVDWELASLAAALPVRYGYEPGQVPPAGATGVVGPAVVREGVEGVDDV